MSSIPVEIPYPQEPKQPLLFLADISSSMTSRIPKLIDGLRLLKNEILKDDIAKKRVEVAVLAFGGPSNNENSVKLVQGFVPVENFDVDQVSNFLVPQYGTPMGHALLKAIEVVEQRKQEYKSQGINYYRPWIWLLTDGYPTDIIDVNQLNNLISQGPNADVTNYCSGDLYNRVISSLKDGIDRKKFILWSVIVGKPNDPDLKLGFKILSDCIMSKADPSRPPAWLEDTNQKWSAMFQWLSASIRITSTSRPGETVKLPDPSGWAQFKVE